MSAEPGRPHRLTIGAAIGLCAVLVAVLMGCGSSSGPQGYLYVGVDAGACIDWVQYIQIVHNGSSVSGTSEWTWKLEPSCSSLPPSHASYNVTGNDNGSQLTLTFSGSSYSGTWSGGNIVLDWPELDGSLTTRTFVPATIDQYNAAVKALG